MKKAHNDEFDLNLIYLKLTSPSKQRLVKASDFFKKDSETEKIEQNLCAMYYQIKINREFTTKIK